MGLGGESPFALDCVSVCVNVLRGMGEHMGSKRFAFSCSLAKHRIGTKRHRVCLEIPQEVSQSELFPKEELSSGQYELTECQASLAPVRPTHSSVRQVEDGLPFPGEPTVLVCPQP